MLEEEEGSNLHWLLAAAMMALGMGIVAARYDDTNHAAQHPDSAAISSVATAGDQLAQEHAP